jgi:hypothetical protein
VRHCDLTCFSLGADVLQAKLHLHSLKVLDSYQRPCVSKSLLFGTCKSESLSLWRRGCFGDTEITPAKTYNRRDSQMVTHSSTSRPVQCYVWQSGRDAQFSLTYGRMCYLANVRRIYYVDSNALGCLQQVDLPGPEAQRQCSLQIFGTIEMTPPPTFLADTVSALLEVVV